MCNFFFRSRGSKMFKLLRKLFFSFRKIIFASLTELFDWKHKRNMWFVIKKKKPQQFRNLWTFCLIFFSFPSFRNCFHHSRKKHLSKYSPSLKYLPIFRLWESFNLFIEINNNFLMLLLQQMSRFFRFQMNIFKKLAHFAQLNVTLAVDFKLKENKVGNVKCFERRAFDEPLTWFSAPPSASSRRSESEITCTLKSAFSRSIWKERKIGC